MSSLPPGPVGVDGSFLIQLLEDDLYEEFPEWPLFGQCQGIMVEKMKKYLEPFNGEFMIVFNGIVPQQFKPIDWRPHRLPDPTVCKPFSEVYNIQENPFPRCEIAEAGLTWLISCLKELYPGQVMRAPYYSSSQLAAFYIQNLIGSIYGSDKMFIFPIIDHVYTYEKGSAAPVIHRKTSPNTVRTDSLVQFVSPVFAMTSNKQGPRDSLESYYDLDEEARRMVSEGYTDALQEEIHNTFGEAIPTFIHKAVSAGFFPNTIGLSIATHTLDKYRFVLNFDELRMIYELIIPLRAQIIFQSLALLPESAISSYELVYKCSDVHEQAQPGRGMLIINPPKIILNEWSLNTLEEEMRARGVRSLKPQEDWLRNLDYMSSKGEQSPPGHPWYKSEDIYIYATCLKSIDLMGYFTHSTIVGESDESGTSVFADALCRCRDDPPRIHTAALLFIESVRTDHLHGKVCIVKGESTAPVAKLLAARIMSLVPLRMDGSKWEGPFNIQVFAYNQIVCFLYTALQSLVEAVATTTLSQEIRARDPYNEPWIGSSFDILRAKFTCRDPPSPFMGFVALYLMNTPLEQISWDSIKATFPNATHIQEDIKDAFLFFTKARDMIGILATDNVGQTDVDISHFKELDIVQISILEPVAKKLGFEMPPIIYDKKKQR
eukprot:Tbor_TRINITY_DN5184_c2_g9::TRINITY_DN5184_c2_g9_i1::g.25855::m.25855